MRLFLLCFQLDVATTTPFQVQYTVHVLIIKLFDGRAMFSLSVIHAMLMDIRAQEESNETGLLSSGLHFRNIIEYFRHC